MSFERIRERRLLPAVGLDDPRDAEPLARALLEGGVDVMEVPLRAPKALECVKRIREAVPAMACGAGTIVDPDQLPGVQNASASFGVSPGFHPATLRAAREARFPMIPGCMTPGEMEQALALGHPLVKFFPAEAAGGLDFLRALAGPYGHTDLRIIPMGGVDRGNLRDYLASPLVAALGGSWIAPRSAIRNQRWDQISELARETVDIVASA